MEHKLIMENWRKHLSEIGMSQAALGVSDKEYQQITRPASDLNVDKLTNQEIYELISFFDPTQITQYPAAAEAIENFKESPTWLNAAIVTVAILALVPVLGKFAKVGKLKVQATKIGKKLKTSKDPKLLKKAAEIDKNKNLRKTPKVSFDRMVLKSKKIVDNLKLGQTIVLKDDLYLFVRAKDTKVSGGFVAPSIGINKEIETVLEKARKSTNSGAVPRTNTVYMTPFSDAKRWKDYGPETYVVKVPKGSKISKMDADAATEVSAKLNSGDKVGAEEWAKEYWEGADAGMGRASEEIMTQAKVQVIGTVDKVLKSGYSKFATQTPSMY
jgi:hypothetical protein